MELPLDPQSGFSIFKSQEVVVWDFLVNLLIAAVLSTLLALVYRRFGRSLSEKGSFAATFLPITLTTAMIISILQTNIVLSLGLVGALSIIRFRTAIKEPEELSYIFFCIALGLGLGAGQRTLTLAGFVMVAGVLAGRGLLRQPPSERSMLLTIAGQSASIDPEHLLGILQESCSLVDLRRLEEADGTSELVFVVELERLADLSRIRTALIELDDSLTWSFVDHRPLS